MLLSRALGDRALWKDDLQRMKQYGIEVIRLAEFSWALMEPEEGKYDFSFWDEFLALAAEGKYEGCFFARLQQHRRHGCLRSILKH